MRALSFYPDIRMLRLTRRELETEPTGQPRQLSTLRSQASTVDLSHFRGVGPQLLATPI
jgi:hypothetical protein